MGTLHATFGYAFSICARFWHTRDPLVWDCDLWLHWRCDACEGRLL